jgi:hypothetical protein
MLDGRLQHVLHERHGKLTVERTKAPHTECAGPCRQVRLEVEATAELQRARQVGIVCACEVRDIAKGTVPYGCIWIGDKLWVVQQVECLDTNLELALTKDVEASEDARVDIGNTGSTELVAMRRAEARATVRICPWVRKTCWINQGLPPLIVGSSTHPCSKQEPGWLSCPR